MTSEGSELAATNASEALENMMLGKFAHCYHDILSTQVLLKSYGEKRGHEVNTAEARIIFYYGARSLPRPWSLVSTELDEHFQFDVRDAVEHVTTYFRERLDAVLAAAE